MCDTDNVGLPMVPNHFKTDMPFMEATESHFLAGFGGVLVVLTSTAPIFSTTTTIFSNTISSSIDIFII